jgi:anti-sigma factor (TIGR02949 family)
LEPFGREFTAGVSNFEGSLWRDGPFILEEWQMTCRGVQNRISAFVDGELTGFEMLEIRQHIGRCSACSDEVELHRQAKRTLATLPDVEVPAGLEERLVSRMKCAQTVSPRHRGFQIFFASAVVAVAAAAFTTVILRSNQERTVQANQQLDERAFEVARDQAYMDRVDRLGGGSGVISVNYVK